jgi:hypothetical protein
MTTIKKCVKLSALTSILRTMCMQDTYALIILVVAIVVYYWVPEEAQEKAEIGSAMNMTRASRTSRASVDLLTVMPGPRPSFSALAEHTEESTHTTPLETHSEVE